MSLLTLSCADPFEYGSINNGLSVTSGSCNFVDDSVLHFRDTGPEGFPVAEMTFTSLKVIESNTIW